MTDMSIDVGGLRLKNPVMAGSGTMAEGLAEVIDLGRLGAIVTKTITPDLREGVPPPRIVEYPDATLFAIGIPSKGPDHFIETTVPFYRAFDAPLVASISADTAEDFGRLAAYISVPGVSAIEANVSCPNLRADGKAFGMEPEATAQVVRAMKANTSLPVWAKLTPNVGDIAAIARAAEEAGADALVVANAMLGMAIDCETMRPRLGNVMGGLTGPATKPVILRMAYQCACAVKIPIIGSGGITTAADAAEYMLAGASAVQLGTANFLSPGAMLAVIEELERYCRRKGMHRVEELVGALMTPADLAGASG